MTHSDVLVVGAGPTGLLLASELALAGLEVEVVERRAEPDRTIKAGSISVATAEILDRRGLLPEARAAQRATAAEVARFMTSVGAAGAIAQASASQRSGQKRFPVAGHFAGFFFDPRLVDQADPLLAAHTDVADAVIVLQRDVERILGDHAARLGVRIRRGVEVRSLRSADADTLTDEDRDLVVDTTDGELSASWVVGTDGGRSTIRKAAGIGFPGTDPEITGYQAIVDLDRPELLRPGWTWTPRGVMTFGPLPGRILLVRFVGAPADRDAEVTVAELQEALRAVSGTDIAITALHGTATRWTDNARQASTYRRGRVLLAGDAAHVHSPFSGQGLNLGAGDAAALGWRLAATIRGWAPDDLLDTYTRERHDLGARVLDWTRAQVALMRGDAKTEQLRAVFADEILRNRGLVTRLAAITAGVTQHYDVSDRAASPDSWVGGPVGDVPLADGTRLADAFHGGAFVLLDRTADHRFADAASGWADRLEIRADAPGEGLVGLLVRPDGIVIWDATDADPAGLTAALLRWAGQPRA